MTYIEIDGVKYPCSISTFKTQHGQGAIRVISDAPIAEDGFRLYEDDTQILDASDYKYLYREENTIKEYTKEEETILEAESYSSGESHITPMQRQINSLNRRVNALTPYVVSKRGYYGETEKVFYDVPDGNTLVFFDNYNGSYAIERVGNRLLVSFDTLETETDITVQVQ